MGEKIITLSNLQTATDAILNHVSFTPTGKWQSDKTYNRLDIVQYNGYSYVAKHDGILSETPPEEGDDWMSLVGQIRLSSHWTIQVGTEDWVEETAATYAGIKASYKAAKECEGMTENTNIQTITFVEGDRTSATQWQWLAPGEGSVTLYATTKPASAFSLELTEIL